MPVAVGPKAKRTISKGIIGESEKPNGIKNRIARLVCPTITEINVNSYLPHCARIYIFGSGRGARMNGENIQPEQLHNRAVIIPFFAGIGIGITVLR